MCSLSYLGTSVTAEERCIETQIGNKTYTAFEFIAHSYLTVESKSEACILIYMSLLMSHVPFKVICIPLPHMYRYQFQKQHDTGLSVGL